MTSPHPPRVEEVQSWWRVRGVGGEEVEVEVMEVLQSPSPLLPFAVYRVKGRTGPQRYTLKVCSVSVRKDSSEAHADKMSQESLDFMNLLEKLNIVEKELQSLLNQPSTNLVPYLGYCTIHSAGNVKFCLLLPPAWSTLDFFLDKEIPVEGDLLTLIAKGSLESLAEMHSRNIVHRYCYKGRYTSYFK